MCLISDKHKLIFFHNPKCGGTSVRYAIDHLCNIKSVKWFKDRNIVNHQFWHHEPAACVRAYFARWAKYDYSAFGLIRNPWDRMVSWWSFNAWSKDYLPKGVVKVDGKYEVLDMCHNTHDKEPEISFDGFIETCYDVMVKSRNRFSYIKLSMDGKAFDGDITMEDFFWPCRLLYPSIASNFFTDNNNNYCVKIFKLEDLDDMVGYVYKRTGVKINISRLNKSKRDLNYRQYYNKKLIKMVEEIYYSDIELGEYRF